jgi:hypothetical protein
LSIKIQNTSKEGGGARFVVCSGCGLEKVVIDIDYSMTDTGSVSALAVGAVKDDSTHHLTVAFASK